jgi:peptidoglycan/xylan/chitin deacetylase (PgdA/CDA1 family)
MKLTITLLAVLLIAALLASCSNAPAVNASLPAGDSALPQSSDEATQPSSAVPSPALAPSPSASAGSEPQKTKALYRMNEAFRLVPLSDDAPAQAVLLTFDDGPKDEDVIAQLLDALDAHKAKAIFFVNGYRVQQKPELLKLIHERGQTIGNHTRDHLNLREENELTIEQQIGPLQTEIAELTGEAPVFFRPPYGAGNDMVKQIAKNHGMLYMTWSNGSLDWETAARNRPDVVIANVLDQLHPGANILMHELPWTAEALDELLTKLTDAGYAFIDPAAISLNH